VALFGIFIDFKLLHPQNHRKPFCVTLSVILTSVKPMQFLNTHIAAMLVTLFGSVTLIRLSQWRNAFSPILSMSSGITTFPPEPLYLVSTPFSTLKSGLYETL